MTGFGTGGMLGGEFGRTMGRRVMVLCLDAFDAPFANRMMDEGRMPALARLRLNSARFELEHGPGGLSRYTGLTWEHFSSGRTPESTGRWSVIDWDARAFEARQLNVGEPPFLAGLDVRCAVFDPPYWKLSAQSNATGVVGWSGHDTGCDPVSVPSGLMAEITARFGSPPSVSELNTMVYPSCEQTEAMTSLIMRTLDLRMDIAEWLFAERCPDWDVAILGFGEPHDAIELFAHGVISDHMLSNHPTAAIARTGLERCYEALDRQIGRLMQRFPDCTLVAFTMHGMGLNDTDLPTMLLLPELMYRMEFEKPFFASREDWREAQVPVLREGEDWNEAVTGAMPPPPPRTLISRAKGKALSLAGRAMRAVTGHDTSHPGELHALKGDGLQHKSYSVSWMPASRYAPFWPQMKAFALPAYFDGRVRINLAGRERFGRVEPDAYEAVLESVRGVLMDCVDTRTGEPVIRQIDMPGLKDPMNLDGTLADLRILWNGSPVGFRHPRYGVIGPGPVRRVGGHSGGHGALYIMADDIGPGDFGVRSSFDVAPTIVDLLGQVRPNWMDGESVLAKARYTPTGPAGLRAGGA